LENLLVVHRMSLALYGVGVKITTVS